MIRANANRTTRTFLSPWSYKADQKVVLEKSFRAVRSFILKHMKIPIAADVREPKRGFPTATTHLYAEER